VRGNSCCRFKGMEGMEMCRVVLYIGGLWFFDWVLRLDFCN
jgi:hypothetical protein